jgi:hypothetical protein
MPPLCLFLLPQNATGNCLLAVDGTQEAFQTCTTLTGTPGAYTFHWSLLPGNRLRGGIDGVNPDGYVGVLLCRRE